jgi:hypothetical protein
LNNPEEDGGFWLPNIQRPFVWTEDQMCRLFDSILREYPISTLLVWKTKSTIRRRKFIDNFRTQYRQQLTAFYVPEDNKKKCLVLDGQQRLQALFIGLKGSYDGKELFLHILSGELSAPDDVRYEFAFLDPQTASFPWVKFKDLVFSKQDILTAAEAVGTTADRALTLEERQKISKHVSLVFKAFHSDDGIAYQELDSIENEDLYTEDDVVEIFIRANSGGTRLGKSDLLFSLLTSAWDNADDEMEVLLAELNRHGFAFNRDFILKTCLTLLDQGAQYEVRKFRRPGVRDRIEDEWPKLAQAMMDVLDFVRGKTFIRTNKALPSYLVLIPLIYTRYKYASSWATSENMDTYLLRCSLSGAFSGRPDQLINEIVTRSNELKGFDLNEFFGVVRSQNRSLELTESRFWAMGYGSDTIHLLFNLWYRDFNYTPAYNGNMPQIDHIFPKSELRKVKTANPNTGRLDVLRYPEAARNQLANCMLLRASENGSGGKWNKLPKDWLADKPEEYLDMHLIPRDPNLWEIDHFDAFINERKQLIRSRFKYLLVRDEPAQNSDLYQVPNG